MAGVKGMEVKYKPFKAALNRLLDQADKHHAGPKKWDDIALALYKRAKAGDVQAIKEIADRTDGKVPQSIGGDAELGPIGVVITGVIRADDEEVELSMDRRELINKLKPLPETPILKIECEEAVQEINDRINARLKLVKDCHGRTRADD